MRLATEEDLARDFPDGFVIGFPVRPQPEDEQPEHEDAEEQRPET
jgi:hypothetical protein